MELQTKAKDEFDGVPKFSGKYESYGKWKKRFNLYLFQKGFRLIIQLQGVDPVPEDQLEMALSLSLQNGKASYALQKSLPASEQLKIDSNALYGNFEDGNYLAPNFKLAMQQLEVHAQTRVKLACKTIETALIKFNPIPESNKGIVKAVEK
jgi:hypothetical protein